MSALRMTLITIAVLIPVGRADAQHQIYFQNIPDYELRTTLYDTGEAPAWVWQIEASPALRTGPSQDSELGFTGMNALFFRWQPFAALSFLAESTLGVSAEVDGHRSPDEMLQGRHRVATSIGVGEASGGLSPTELQLTYQLEHADDRVTFARPLHPDNPFFDHQFGATLWFNRPQGRVAWSVPFGYELRNLAVSADAGSDIWSHTAWSGIGLRMPGVGGTDSYLQLLGMDFARLELGAGVSANRMGFEIGVPFTLFRFADERFALFVAESMGADWMWEEGGGTSGSVFTTQWGIGVRADWDAQSFLFGTHFARDGVWIPGVGPRAHNRFEAEVSYRSVQASIGLSHRTALGWLAYPEVEQVDGPDLPDAVPTHSLHTEWFVGVGPFEVGPYHRANYAARPADSNDDLFAADSVWSHEVGVFLRLSEFGSDSNRSAVATPLQSSGK